MFAGGTEKKDKHLVNSILNMDHIFENVNGENIKNEMNETDNKINSEINNIPNININNISNNSNSINSENNINNNNINNKDNFFGFENIELPKEEDIGEFRVISNSNSNSSSLNRSATIKTEKKQKIDLINLIIINKTFKIKKKVQSIKAYITSIYYNNNSKKHKFDIKTYKSPCYIFDSSIKEIIGDLDINYSNNFFLYMSYRSGFESLNNVGCGNYTSDCGWGCMVRCCQMMLSRGLIKRELNNMRINKKVISNTDILELKKEILCLFNDKFIPFDNLKNNKFLKELYKKYNRKENTFELIPPYSIYTLCKLNKCSGANTSDLRIIKCFVEINEQLFKKYYGIIHFENGIILKKKILETFCTKRDLIKKEDKNNIKINPITNIKEEISSIKDINKNDPFGMSNIFENDGEEYIFTKGGIIFISLRLGLRDLDPYYFNIIPLLFEKFHNNIGFVSGKKSKAFYFIGYNGDNKLIYADPHWNQKAENDDISTYEIKDLYLLDINQLSSGITIGININNSTDLKILINELTWFNKNHSNVMTFK